MGFVAPLVSVSAFTAPSQVGPILWVPGGTRVSVTVAGTFTGTLRIRRQLDTTTAPGTTNSQTHRAPVAGDSLDFVVGAGSYLVPFATALSAGQADVVMRADAPGGDRDMPFQARNIVQATVGALNAVCGPVLVLGGGWFSAVHVGTFSGTLVVEKSFDGTNWQIHDSSFVNSEDYQIGATCLMRVRCSAYTSGSLTVWAGVDQPGG